MANKKMLARQDRRRKNKVSFIIFPFSFISKISLALGREREEEFLWCSVARDGKNNSLKKKKEYFSVSPHLPLRKQILEAQSPLSPYFV